MALKHIYCYLKFKNCMYKNFVIVLSQYIYLKLKLNNSTSIFNIKTLYPNLDKRCFNELYEFDEKLDIFIYQFLNPLS